VQIDREIAYLTAPDELQLSEQEARQLIATINQHFGEELQIRYHKPQQWLVRKHLQLNTHTPSEAVLQNVKSMQPSGEDARSWSNVLNEIQMLLHAHPVNAARQENNRRPVNSLWLWGGGDIQVTEPGIDVIYSNNSLAAEAAVRNAIAHEPLPDTIDVTMLENRRVLMLVTEQISAIQRHDVYAWIESLKRLEKNILTPLFTLLRQNKLQSLTIIGDGMWLVIRKQDLNKWWRRRSRMDKTILALRKSYAIET